MSLKNTMISIFVIVIVALLLSDNKPKEYAHWGYDEELGPKNWPELDERFAICEQGLNQSPINITNVIDAQLSPLKFQGESKAKTFVNNGHTLQVNFESGSFLTIENKKYSLKQMHFHTPSENQINGKSYPMEAHLVHADSYNNLAVVSIMFEVSEDNIVLNKLLRNLPEESDESQVVKSEVSSYEILPQLREYYTFNGSLTTPPCSEGVRWIVLKTPVEISQSQLTDFKNNMPKNNRPIQNINSRYILD